MGPGYKDTTAVETHRRAAAILQKMEADAARDAEEDRQRQLQNARLAHESRTRGPLMVSDHFKP